MIRDLIFEYVAEKFGVLPEYLWTKYPNYAVLRRWDTGKWFVVIMNISKNELGMDSLDNVDIMNVKCDPIMIGSLRMQKGFFPAYHMNKDNWITILLDGTVSSETILEMVNMSYELVGKREKAT